MSNLSGAYNSLSSTLKKQKQGTCGLYSFWFATLLLEVVNHTGRPIPYPRQSVGGTKGGTTRYYAKHTLHSGQGEVLTATEMEDIIKHFGYNYQTHLQPEADRATFITRQLGADHPVMFPYMMGNSGPISSFPVGKTPGVDYGSHWSLIYDEDATDYIYIEPNTPTTPTRRTKKQVLDSNAFVDSYKYDRYWTKGADSSIAPVQNTFFSTLYGWGLTLGTRVYDIGPSGRQNLKGVLIAVS